jgi:hypothetical protein
MIAIEPAGPREVVWLPTSAYDQGPRTGCVAVLWG